MNLANVDDARGLSFSCLPGCGFCCTATPLVLAPESARLGSLVVRADDGSLRIPVNGLACSALQPDRRCGVYDARPAVCRVYPYQVHAGRRIQAVVTLACPGVGQHTPTGHEQRDGALHPVHDDEDMTRGAHEVGAFVLSQSGAAEMAAEAKATFAEFDRRMKDWVPATPDRLRSAFQPHLPRLAMPESLPSYFAGLREGDLTLDAKDAVDRLFDAEPESDLEGLLEDAARDAFEGNLEALWVDRRDVAAGGAEPEFSWAAPAWREGAIAIGNGSVAIADVVTAWTPDASAILERYLARLTRRDHTEGAAAWIVDASSYQATLPAAYGRVLGEAALQVVLRAGIIAAQIGAEEIDARLAGLGIAAYETSYHSMPTIGAIL